MSWASENSQETDNGTAASALPLSPKRVRCPLRTVGDVSAEIAKVYREARSGILPVDHASKYAHILSIVGRLLVETALEDRVAALESAAK